MLWIVNVHEVCDLSNEKFWAVLSMWYCSRWFQLLSLWIKHWCFYRTSSVHYALQNTGWKFIKNFLIDNLWSFLISWLKCPSFPSHYIQKCFISVISWLIRKKIRQVSNGKMEWKAFRFDNLGGLLIPFYQWLILVNVWRTYFWYERP